MDGRRDGTLTSVKGSLIRQPGRGRRGAGAALAALLGLNVRRVRRAAWNRRGCSAAVIIADMLVIGAGILVAAREVLVAEHRTEASQARLDAIVDSAMDAIITVDEAQNIVLFNRAAEQVFRCGARRCSARRSSASCRSAFAARTAATSSASAAPASPAGAWATSPRCGRCAPSGEEFPIEASISQAGEGGERYFTVILRDITLRKQAEDALRRRSTSCASSRRACWRRARRKRRTSRASCTTSSASCSPR